MAEDAPPLPPPEDHAADERTTLVDMLDYYRTVLARKTWGLTPEQAATTIDPSDLTLPGLLFHMAMVEDTWFAERFGGADKSEPWASADWDADWDWEFHVAPTMAHTDVVAQFDTSVARSKAVLAEVDSLDAHAVAKQADGSAISMRWILVHMIEEYARHVGHADLIRQVIDGQTGD